MSVAGLLGYMEKNKSAFKKLKKGYLRLKKQEESRLMNCMFKTDPARVYTSLNEIARKEEENARPFFSSFYDTSEQDENKELFVNINEVSDFW